MTGKKRVYMCSPFNKVSGHQFISHENPYLHTFLFIRALSHEVSLIAICSFHAEETVGCVPDATGEHSVPQHGIDDRTLSAAGSAKEGKHSVKLPSLKPSENTPC